MTSSHNNEIRCNWKRAVTMKRKSKYFWYESKLYGANYTKALDCDANMEECNVRYVSVLQVSQSLSLSSPACFPPNLHTCKQIFGVYNDLDEVLFAFLNHSTKLSFFNLFVYPPMTWSAWGKLHALHPPLHLFLICLCLRATSPWHSRSLRGPFSPSLQRAIFSARH